MAKAYTGAQSLADFKQLCLLGEGAYSAVYKVLRLADREIYALKKVKLPSLSDKEKQNALNEVRLLASIKHENIIAYKEAFFDDKTRCLCIVTEYADSGDLFQQITKCQKERVHPKEADVWRYLVGMCHGLKALHDMRILHRDLKCANVFLRNSGNGVEALLGDFNVSKVAKRGLCMTQTGTPYYASPEVWRDMPYDAKSDMWSLGCVLYEMVALKPPFRAEDMEGLYRKVLRGQYPRIPAHFSNDLSEVIGVLLQVNPRHRPSIDQLLQMPVTRRHAATTEPEHRPLDLLSTIKMPKNAIDISGCLPEPRYDLNAGYNQLPHSQESAGDIAGGTAKLVPARARGQPALPTQAEDASPRQGGDNYHDSLDAYLSSPPPPSQAPAQGHRAPPMPSGHPGQVGHGGGAPMHSQPAYQYQAPQAAPVAAAAAHPPPSSVSGHLPQLVQERQDRGDSLDNYVQRQSRPARQQRLPSDREYADYSRSEDPRYRQASPAPSSQAPSRVGPPIYSRQPAYDPQPAYGVQQYRHQRGSGEHQRRNMASYARPQYQMGSGGSSAAQAAPSRQAGGGIAQAAPPRQQTGGGLRLPRIFTKG
jgi:serine/threonine protein kinase